MNATRDRVRRAGVVHRVDLVTFGIDWKRGRSTSEDFVGFLCDGLYQPVRLADFVDADVDCMTCLVVEARKDWLR